MAREAFKATSEGRVAEHPAGAVLEWGVDESREMARTGDSIDTATVVWNIPAPLIPGAIVNTATRSSIFIAAPAVPSDEPYRVTLTYQTIGGRTRVKAFWHYVLDPILFV